LGSGLYLCGCAGAQGLPLHLQVTIRSLGTSKPTCIKVKFTSIPRRMFRKMGRWLTEEAAPGVPHPETASPVHLSRWQWMTGARVLSPKPLESR